MNKVIWLLIISDILILSAFGLIAPIFAIFLNEGITGGSIVAAGTASAIFFIIKSIVQLPLSLYLDKKRDKLGFLLAGTFIIVIIPLFYAFSQNIKFIFIAQAAYALGAAMAYPSWISLFSMHLDRKHRGFEWSLWSTSVGIGTAITAYIGAVVAQNIGFRNLFFIVSGISFAGLVVLFFISRKYLKDVERIEGFVIPWYHNHKK
ncbi:MFS transporter [Candidatus Pacearchaeota archaeon]|nr:MFS transporter [Candidatus Pacearchaeota archaeon]